MKLDDREFGPPEPRTIMVRPRRWYTHDTQCTETRTNENHEDYWRRYEGWCRRCQMWVPMVTFFGKQPSMCNRAEGKL